MMAHTFRPDSVAGVFTNTGTQDPSQLNENFSLRRSVRNITKSPEDIARFYININKDQNGLAIRYINDVKGYGVFTEKCFSNKDFLAEYVGEWVTEKQAEEREKRYSRKNRNARYPRCFTYYLKYNGKSLCIDATNTNGRVGSLVNDCITEDQSNAKMKKIIIEEKLHLVLFATKDIKENEEILYDYGSGEECWWRKIACTKTTSAIDSQIKEDFDDNDDDVKDPDFVLPNEDDSEYDMEEGFDEEDLDFGQSNEDNSDHTNSQNDVSTVKQIKETEEVSVKELTNSEQSMTNRSKREGKKRKAEDEYDTIKVMASNNDDRRVWDRENSCLFCGILQTNLRRHLFRKHRDELEVAKALSYPTKSIERKNALGKLRCLGNFYSNARVRELGRGMFLVVKRPAKGKEVSYKSFLPCMFCKGFFFGKDIWRYYQDCKFKDDVTVDEEECTKIQSLGHLGASRILAETMSLNSTKAQTVQLFGSMRKDDVAMACQNDQIISSLGHNLLLKNGVDQINYARAKMREISRLLLQVRKNCSDEELTLQAILAPAKFDSIIDAVLTECKYALQSDIARFEVPSLALKLGHNLRKCCYIKIGMCIKSNDSDGEKEAEQFLKLVSMEYANKVSSIALKTLSNNNRHKQKPLPLTEDIVTFRTFIHEQVNSLSQSLQEEENDGNQDLVSTFHDLAKATLSKLMTFNKRRSGEVAKMLVKDFEYRNNERDQNHDIAEMMSSSEKKLISRLKLMQVKGKRGRTVPIILTETDVGALKLLSDPSIRAKVGISNSNLYVFPLGKGSVHNIRGSDALGEMVSNAGLKNSSSFKSTALRKYIATVSQVLNMDENELDWLASHLGHDIRVHRQYYRLQSQQVELAKVAKLLFAVDNGKAHSFVGQKLNDIKIDELDKFIEEEEISDDEDTEADMDEKGINEGESSSSTDVMKSKSNKQNGKKIVKQNGKQCCHRVWSKEEKAFIMEEFRDAIRNRSIGGVGKRKIEEVMKKGGNILQNRTWVQVKSALKNIIDRMKKQEHQLDL